MRICAITCGKAQSASLIALSAFAIHQVRYLFAYGSGVGGGFAEPGHGYLAHAVPLLVGLVVAILIARLVRGVIGGQDRPAERRVKATSYALGIAAVFSCLELIEGALLAGHASGLAAIFSAGGWSALPLAVLFGFLSAVIDRGIEAIELLVGVVVPRRRRPPLRLGRPGTPVWLGQRPSPLALCLAQRPPPARV